MNRRNCLAVSVAAVSIMASGRAQGCAYHWLLGLPEPTGIWPTSPGAAASELQTQDAADDAAIASAILSPTSTSTLLATPAMSTAAAPLTNPTIDTYVNSWMINTTGVKGRSTDTTINTAVDKILANVQEVAYTSTDVYIKATGIPDYNIGPFNGNPNVPENDNATFDITRNPKAAAVGSQTATGLGAIGVLINGVDVFNMSDSFSYQNQGVWHDNAGVVEAPSFDSANAHPQQQGVYHNHENPVSLEAELGASSTKPMVIGYAIDGYPILNDYASLTPGGPVVKMMSGYQLRTYSNNIRGSGGPNVGGQYPDGYFEEDYQYLTQTEPAGEAELDTHNGAFVYSPQFPDGTYAYFATTDNSGNAAYPYLVGQYYYGTPLSDDLPGSTVVVPDDAVLYSVPEPTGLVGIAMIGLMMGRRRTRRS